MPGVEASSLNYPDCSAIVGQTGCEIAEYDGIVYQISWGVTNIPSAYVRETASQGTQIVLHQVSGLNKAMFRTFLSNLKFSI